MTLVEDFLLGRDRRSICRKNACAFLTDRWTLVHSTNTGRQPTSWQALAFFTLGNDSGLLTCPLSPNKVMSHMWGFNKRRHNPDSSFPRSRQPTGTEANACNDTGGRRGANAWHGGQGTRNAGSLWSSFAYPLNSDTALDKYFNFSWIWLLNLQK